MGFAVYHVEKGKSNATAIGHHIDRTDGKEHSYRQADPERKSENVHFRGLHNGAEKKDLQTAIDDRIKEGYKGKRAIRKDAVKYLKHVTTGSHKEMTQMAKEPEKFKKWVKANIEFMKEEFGGKENIVRCSLHMDEKTPHLHFVTVPLTKDGRLSAKEVLGDRKEMSARQDRYADKMAEFGLKRGIKRTGIKHEDAKRYYGRIKEGRTHRISYNIQVQKAPEEGQGLKTQLEKPSMGVLVSKEKWKAYEKKQRDKFNHEHFVKMGKAKEVYGTQLKGVVDMAMKNIEADKHDLNMTKTRNIKLEQALTNKKEKGKGLGLSRMMKPPGL